MSRSRRRRRRLALAALALWTFALPAPPASAIAVPRLNGAGLVDLSVAARAGAALPDGPSVAAAREALEGAGTQTRSRFDDIARAGTEDAAQRSVLKECLSGARDSAVEAWLEGYAQGAPPDFDALMYDGAYGCFTSQFDESVVTGLETYAEVAAGQANDVAYEAVSSADEPESEPETDSDGGSGWLLLVAAGVCVLAAVVYFGRGKS